VQATVLNVKGKTAIKPVQVEVIATANVCHVVFRLPERTILSRPKTARLSLSVRWSALL
jgi:hypothetical protein